MSAIHLSACIEMLFSEVPFADRFAAAKAAGLSAVEFWGWTGKDLGLVKEKLEENRLSLAAMCVSSTEEDYRKYPLVWREGQDAFLRACEESVAAAKKLGVQTLITTVGQERNDVTRAEQHTNIVLGLRRAAALFEDSGIFLVVEPLNTRTDHKGYYLDSSYEAFGILEEVGSPNIRLLYDIYHQQVNEGNLIPNITKHIDLIGHFHAADVPGRLQPGTGEINYKKVFAAIAATDYRGYVGLECRSTGSSEASVKEALALAE